MRSLAIHARRAGKPRGLSLRPPVTSSKSRGCCATSSAAAVMSRRKPPLPPKRRAAGWCGGWPSLIGTRASFSGCSARFCGRSAKVQSDIRGAVRLVYIHCRFRFTEIVEQTAFFELCQKELRILRIEGFAFLERPQLADGRLAFEIQAPNIQLAERKLRPFVDMQDEIDGLLVVVNIAIDGGIGAHVTIVAQAFFDALHALIDFVEIRQVALLEVAGFQHFFTLHGRLVVELDLAELEAGAFVDGDVD